MATAPSAARTTLPQPPLLPLWDCTVLVLLWAFATLVDGFWLLLDQAPPAWDQGEHLTRALNYWRLLLQPQWGSEDWWTRLWQLSPSYRAPLVYLATVPVLILLGRGFDRAVLVNSLFTAVLLVTIYAMGRQFDRATGLWAAAMCTLLPGLAVLRTDYLLDYGLVAMVTLAFGCLCGWRRAGRWGRWGWAVAFGLCLGAVVLTKPTGVLFLVVPGLWVLASSLKLRHWPRWLQALLALGVAVLVCGPWIRTNWLTILSTSGSSNAGWVAPELTLDSPVSVWSYYARMLPRTLTYGLLLTGLGGWGLAVGRALGQRLRGGLLVHWGQLRYSLWLLGFVGGAYGLFSLLKNKDPRHIAPYLPVVALLLVRGVTRWRNWLGGLVRTALTAAMVVVLLGTLFPLGPLPAGRLVRHPYRGPAWPQPEVVATVTEAAPYLRSTVGVLPNLAQLNPMNVDFYGALADFRVYGREVGFNAEFAPLDARSLDWVLAKAGEQGPQNSGNEAKAEVQRRVEESGELRSHRTWPLPDGSELVLYQRQPLSVTVTPLEVRPSLGIMAVDLPAAAPPGVVPITYTLQGTWEELQPGLLLLDWVATDPPDAPTQWIHDHGVGLGHLSVGFQAEPPTAPGFEVTERLGMIVPPETPAGQYRLRARYLTRPGEEPQALPLPETRLTIDPAAAAPPAPEPTLISQLHQFSQGLATGELDPVFNTVGRINQYDPIQAYLSQAEQAMVARLAVEPERVSWLYTQAMAQVLQQEADGAIATLSQLTQVAPDNPYHWLALAFVQIYSWQPAAADQALERAEATGAPTTELQLLQGAAALQRLRLLRAWRLVQASGIFQ